MDTVALFEEFVNAHLEASEKAEADDGLRGKAFEWSVRCFIAGKRLPMEVVKQGKADIRLTYQGKRLTAELKTACGEVEAADKAQLIIYCPYVEQDVPMEWQGKVFTREAWREFLNGYTGRGKFLRADNRGHLHIQSFYVSEAVRPKASKPIANYIDQVLFELPSVDEFLEDR